MKPGRTSIFSRIIPLFAGMVTCLGLVFIAITYVVATNYNESATQLLNKDVAGHIATFTSPFTAAGINHKKADSVFYDAMVLSPSSEVYFLDTEGVVVDYHPSAQPVRQLKLPLQQLQAYIAAGGKQYIKGPDPRDPGHDKIFSAAVVQRNGKTIGYIYVILAGAEARSVAALLLSNNVLLLLLLALPCVILASVFLSFLYVRRIQRRFNKVVAVLDRFQQGDFEARFPIHLQDGLSPVKNAFNTMADMLVYHINQLTKSEADRKTFIAGITHDLRNPLSVAGGFAETLLIQAGNGTLSTENQHAYATLILQKIQKVENMVEQLHQLSALESAAFEPRREPFMFSELLQQVAEPLRLQASEKRITIDCADCTDDAYILADVSMMERVIQNLLVNAVAYSPYNTTVQVRLLRLPGTLCCRIENVAPPLPPALLEWLADTRNQVQPGNLRPAVGLSIVRRILNLHQYTLTAANGGGKVVIEFCMPVFNTGIGL